MNLFRSMKRLYRLVYQFPTEAFYDNQAWYQELTDMYLANNAWTRARLREIKNMAEPAPGDRLLDLGCASGAISHYCAGLGAEVTGVDASPLALRFAKELCLGKNCRFVQADVGHMPQLEAAYFDKAVAADLIEHLPNQAFESMLSETFRILKPGGCLCLYTPNKHHLIERMKAHDFILRQNLSHVAVRSLSEVRTALHRVGLAVNQAYTTASHFPGFNLMERALKHLPAVGPWFGYRLCIRAVKPDRRNVS